MFYLVIHVGYEGGDITEKKAGYVFFFFGNKHYFQLFVRN